MIRAALLALLLSGCIVLPVVDQRTDAVSCCLAVVEVNKTTDGTLQITKPAETLQVKIGARFKF